MTAIDHEESMRQLKYSKAHQQFFIQMALGLVLVTAAGASGASPDPAAVISSTRLGFEVAHGDFGGEGTTTVVTVPLQIGIELAPRWFMQLEIPMVSLHATADQQVVVTGGTSAGRRRVVTETTTTTTVGSTTATGLGDINARLTWSAWEGTGLIPACLLTGYLKLPSGSEYDGLGTGTIEAGPGFALSWQVGTLRLLADAAYYLQNQTSDYAGADYLDYQAGFEFPVGERSTLQMVVKGNTARITDGDGSREVRLKGRYMLSRKVAWDAYLMGGLTSNAATAGAGIAVGFLF